jgi:hypothetical protein
LKNAPAIILTQTFRQAITCTAQRRVGTDTAAQLAATHAPEQKSAAPRLIEDAYRSARRFVTWLTSLSARSRCSALNVGLIRLRAFRRRRRSVAHGLAPGRLE